MTAPFVGCQQLTMLIINRNLVSHGDVGGDCLETQSEYIPIGVQYRRQRCIYRSRNIFGTVCDKS